MKDNHLQTIGEIAKGMNKEIINLGEIGASIIKRIEKETPELITKVKHEDILKNAYLDILKELNNK